MSHPVRNNLSAISNMNCDDVGGKVADAAKGGDLGAVRILIEGEGRDVDEKDEVDCCSP